MKIADIVGEVTIRKANERGHADHGWLDSFHTFSFADYYHAQYMGFRSLRVINEDRVAPSKGFSPHPHQNMEILSYVIEGALAHQDSMGHTSVIKAGEVQKITAGRGIIHSEVNASDQEPVHFYQIWISPERNGLEPSYTEAVLPAPDYARPLLLIGAPVGAGGFVAFHQDVFLFRGALGRGQHYVYPLKAGRGVWVQMVKGRMILFGQALEAGDGAAVDRRTEISLLAEENSEFLLFNSA